MWVGTGAYALGQVVIDLDVTFDLLATVEAQFDLFTIAPF